MHRFWVVKNTLQAKKKNSVSINTRIACPYVSFQNDRKTTINLIIIYASVEPKMFCPTKPTKRFIETTIRFVKKLTYWFISFFTHGFITDLAWFVKRDFFEGLLLLKDGGYLPAIT